VLVYPEGASSALRSDLIVRAVMRSDLTPVPQTIELEVRDTVDTEPLRLGSRLRAGRDETEFTVIKNSPGGIAPYTQGDRPVSTRKLVGLLASCAPIAQRTQRSIVRYGASLGEIYRACGAQVRIDQDFSVSVFACYKGMTPSFEIAKALQEEAGALVYGGGRVAFRRLDELAKSDPVATLREDSLEGVESDFLERHLVPFAFTTDPSGATVSTRSELGRGVLYRPRGDTKTLNNLSTALVTRRKGRSTLAPHIQAGMRLNIGTAGYVVITAAHVMDVGADGGDGEQYTQLWLGEVVK
jgi:hypothetical protein